MKIGSFILICGLVAIFLVHIISERIWSGEIHRELQEIKAHLEIKK